MKKDISVVPYDPNWPCIFEKEAALLRGILGHRGLALHHIGSTSVPGLRAKPKIDMALVVKMLQDVHEPLEKIGFEYRGEYNIPMRHFFKKRAGSHGFNLHVYEEGHAEIDLNLVFRDALRGNFQLRERYGQLKLDILQDEASFFRSKSGFPHDTLKKGDFIRGVLKEAGFDRLRMLRCTDETEQLKGLGKDILPLWTQTLTSWIRTMPI